MRREPGRRVSPVPRRAGSSAGTVAEQEPKRISYRWFLTHYDGVHAEWVDGKVVPMSPVTDEHALVKGYVYMLVGQFVQAKSLGLVLDEPFQMKTGRRLPGRSPDVLFVARRHLRRVARVCVEGPADLVVEVISPDSRGRDRGEKFYEYEKGGVPEYWLIDPVRRQAEFYQRGRAGIYTLVPVGREGRYRSRALPGFWMEVGWLWTRPSLLAILRKWKLVR